MFSGLDLMTILYRIPIILLAITVHEFSHGYVAYKLGDPTAKNSGRLSLNPITHLDPLGALSLLIFGFGWAKPVPINPWYFKNKKQGMSLVGIAGPLSNLLFALVATIIYGLLLRFGFFNTTTPIVNFVYDLLMVTIGLNVGLAIFNLIPIPPLDGSKIINVILPDRIYYRILQYERYALPLLLILMYFNILTPVLEFLSGHVINSLQTVIDLILGNI